MRNNDAWSGGRDYRDPLRRAAREPGPAAVLLHRLAHQ